MRIWCIKIGIVLVLHLIMWNDLQIHISWGRKKKRKKKQIQATKQNYSDIHSYKPLLAQSDIFKKKKISVFTSLWCCLVHWIGNNMYMCILLNLHSEHACTKYLVSFSTLNKFLGLHIFSQRCKIKGYFSCRTIVSALHLLVLCKNLSVYMYKVLNIFAISLEGVKMTFQLLS
jgi:hypothetical protein